MTVVARAIVVGVAALATFVFTYWVPFSLLPGVDALPWLPLVGALVTALGVARALWKGMASSGGFVSAVLVGAAIAGAIGFTAGFFGPLLVTPEANHGPLLGIFITGPLGFLIGGIGGGIRWQMRRGARDRDDGGRA